jgi:hypothetical protein
LLLPAKKSSLLISLACCFVQVPCKKDRANAKQQRLRSHAAGPAQGGVPAAQQGAVHGRGQGAAQGGGHADKPLLAAVVKQLADATIRKVCSLGCQALRGSFAAAVLVLGVAAVQLRANL